MIVSAAVGRGCIYALTDKGDLFHWGSTPCGGGGGGGGGKAAAAPAKVPGIKGAVAVAASAAGRFAAVIDDGGRLFTFGAGGLYCWRMKGFVGESAIVIVVKCINKLVIIINVESLNRNRMGGLLALKASSPPALLHTNMHTYNGQIAIKNPNQQCARLSLASTLRNNN